ncbi:hypothetical protein QI305_12180 [Staphylococcus saprophyticus]|nr:hypothetical protein [Staphylococcus saprophyticus]
MTIYNLFWLEDYGSSWAFLGSYESEEKAKKGMMANMAFREIENDELEDYVEDYFIESVTINQYVLKEYNL